jgi:hypothetical protein
MNKGTVYVDLDDEITTITDKVQSSKDKLIALVLPKHCVVLQSSVNMKILNKIAKDNGKTIVLITAEASILSIAGAIGVYVAKTLQSKPYLPDSSNTEEPAAEVSDTDEKDGAENLDNSKPIGELAVAAGVELDDDAPIELGDETAEKVPGKDGDKKDKKLRVPNFEKFRLWVILAIVGAAILIGGGVYAAKALPRATVIVTTQNQAVPVAIVVTGSLTATTVDLANKIVPAEVKTIEQPVTATFQATGEKNNGNKATGQVLFYNCSKDDKLSDTPRTVPTGTSISNSGFVFITQGDAVVQPSGFNGDACKYDKASAAVGVTAQSGGDSYNLSPRDYSVSGFGSMTATDEDGMGGGTNQLVTAVSQADCDTAKNGLIATKTDDYKNQLSAQLTTAGLLPIRDTFVAATGEVTCNPTVGVEATQSTATLTFSLSMMGVNITSLDQLIIAEVAQQNSKQSVFDTGAKTALVTLREKAASGDVTFNLQTSAQTGMQQDAEAIANLIAGKKYGESLSTIKSQSGVADAKVSYSPFWVSQTPKDTKRINVTFISQ